MNVDNNSILLVQGHRMMVLGVDMCSVLCHLKTMYHSQESTEIKLDVIKLSLWLLFVLFCKINMPLNCNIINK